MTLSTMIATQFGTLNHSNPENQNDFRRVASELATFFSEDGGEEAKYFCEGRDKPMGNARSKRTG